MIPLVYYIDRTIYDEFSKRQMTVKEKLLFSDLATMFHRGKCVLLGNMQSIELLINVLSDPTDLIYSMVRAHYVEQRSVIESVKKVFIITFNEDNSSNSLPEILSSSENNYFLPVPVIENCQINQSCILLAENLNDCIFYKIIANYYRIQHNLENFCISFSNELGGGNTISTVFSKCVLEDKSPTICIVDSDRTHEPTSKYPGAPKLGGTYNDLKRIENSLFNMNDIPPFYVLALDAREIENLIPLNVLEAMQSELPAMSTGLEMLRKLLQIQNKSPILFYDIKKGLPKITDEPARDYWMEIMISLGASKENMPLRGLPKDKNGKDISPKDVFFPSVSSNRVLERAIEIMKKSDTIQLETYLVDLWEQLGELLFTWGCASQPIRS